MNKAFKRKCLWTIKEFLDNNQKEAKTLQINSCQGFENNLNVKVDYQTVFKINFKPNCKYENKNKAILQGSEINRVVYQNTKSKESHRLSYFELRLLQLSQYLTQYSTENLVAWARKSKKLL